MASKGHPLWLELRARGYSDRQIGQLLAARVPVMGRQCRECGAEFTAVAWAKDCSPRCHNRYHRRLWRARQKAARLSRLAAKASDG